MRQTTVKTFICILLIILGANYAFAQCGADGRQPCKTKIAKKNPPSTSKPKPTEARKPPAFNKEVFKKPDFVADKMGKSLLRDAMLVDEFEGRTPTDELKSRVASFRRQLLGPTPMAFIVIYGADLYAYQQKELIITEFERLRFDLNRVKFIRNGKSGTVTMQFYMTQ